MDLGQLERLNEHHDLSTFVVPFAGTLRVAAFFGLSAAGIEKAALPKRLQPFGAPRTISATLLGRLAIDVDAQGKGLSQDLILAALSEAIEAQKHVAAAFIIVDAAGEKAQRLYGHYQFRAIEDVKGRITRMVLPMATAIDMTQLP